MGASSGLGDVWGSSSCDVFAVGDNGTILHYDGVSWGSMASGTGANLRAVWGASSSDVFAAGEAGTILHYDGSDWTPMESGTAAQLNGLWGSSPADLFAVGSGGTILYYDGHRWMAMATGTTSNLNAIWGSPGSYVYAVGNGGTILRCADPSSLLAETALADMVTVSAARLNGYLASLGADSAAQVYFEWGLTTEYGNSTPPQARGGIGPFSASVGGLLPGTTYHFRAVARANGTACGPDLTFATPDGAPVAATSLASDVTPYGAVLNGTVIHLGSQLSVYTCLEWGPTSSYGHTTGPQYTYSLGAFSANITGLAPGTTYHFRARAEGGGLVVYGDDMTFVTAAEPAVPPADPPTDEPAPGPAPAGPDVDPASPGAPAGEAPSGQIAPVEDGVSGDDTLETLPLPMDVSPDPAATPGGSAPDENPAPARVWVYPIAVIAAFLGLGTAASFAVWLRYRLAT